MSNYTYTPITQALLEQCLAGNCTNFEIMACNDCTFFGGPFWRNDVGVYLRIAYNYFGYMSMVISGFTGFLVLSKKENRTRYPHKFIGLICLAQSCSIYTLNSFDHNFCELPVNPIIKNFLVTPTSWIS